MFLYHVSVQRGGVGMAGPRSLPPRRRGVGILGVWVSKRKEWGWVSKREGHPRGRIGMAIEEGDRMREIFKNQE